MHLGSGGPKTHYQRQHNIQDMTRDTFVNNTKILRKEGNYRRLQVFESLYIQQKCPKINKQTTGSCRILKLYSNHSTIH